MAEEMKVFAASRAPVPCPICGTPFVPWSARTRKAIKTCSVECGRKLVGRGVSLHRAGKGKLIDCPRCGKPFWPWANGEHPRKFCSRACVKRPPKPVEATPPVLGPCAWCSAMMVVRHGRRFCSRECAKRATTARKHLRRRGLRRKQDTIPLGEIYLREKGRCGLCHQRVPVRLKPPHPRSATLDHIVPLHEGGKHVRENVQLAHYGCNSRKGTRPCGSQLRLVG
jgi:5-methylcytosine-specific restriction endonuclease McrA